MTLSTQQGVSGGSVGGPDATAHEAGSSSIDWAALGFADPARVPPDVKTAIELLERPKTGGAPLDEGERALVERVLANQTGALEMLGNLARQRPGVVSGLPPMPTLDDSSGK